MRALALGLWIAALAPGCKNPEERACLSEYETAQKQVLGVDPKSDASVKQSLAAVEAALALCQKAKRHGESDELIKAKNELSAQVGLLERRARRKPRAKATPEELQRLEKEGDPSCPRGQAYRPEGAKEIRCSGPQLVEMSAAQARAYFEERDYRVRTLPPATLDIERGSERYTFVYEKLEAGPPGCAKLVPPPDTSWQEAVARASGANPARLKPSGGTLSTARGPVPYSVDEKNVVIRIGQCP